MAADYDGLRQEITRLRDWRHDYAAPLLAALKALLDPRDGLASHGGRIDSLDGRVREMIDQMQALELKVERMARADEVAAAVVAAQKTEKTLILSRSQKIIGSVAAAFLFVVAMVDFVRTFTG